jgi:hypothetical protein
MLLKAIANFNAFRSIRYKEDMQDIEEGKERKFEKLCRNAK